MGQGMGIKPCPGKTQCKY